MAQEIQIILLLLTIVSAVAIYALIKSVVNQNSTHKIEGYSDIYKVSYDYKLGSGIGKAHLDAYIDDEEMEKTGSNGVIAITRGTLYNKLKRDIGVSEEVEVTKITNVERVELVHPKIILRKKDTSEDSEAAWVNVNQPIQATI